MLSPSSRRVPEASRSCRLSPQARERAQRPDERALERAVVVTQVVVLLLCAARVHSDLSRGIRTFEGHLAVVLAAALSASLALRFWAWVSGARHDGA